MEYQAKIKSIHQAFKEDNSLYQDKDFPPLDIFLFKEESEIEAAKKDLQNWDWVRPNEISKNAIFDEPNSPTNYEIKSGRFSNRKFLNAISLLCPTAFYRNLFVDFNHMEMGYVSCQFYKNGKWHYVIIDTQIPYSF